MNWRDSVLVYDAKEGVILRHSRLDAELPVSTWDFVHQNEALVRLTLRAGETQTLYIKSYVTDWSRDQGMFIYPE